MVEEAIQNYAFEFLHALILKLPQNHSKYTFLVDVLDSLIKNFICYYRETVCSNILNIFKIYLASYAL